MTCKKCGRCCTYIELSAHAESDVDDVIEWLTAHRDIEAEPVGDGYIKITIRNECKNLFGNRCRCYEGRPKVCREYHCEATVK